MNALVVTSGKLEQILLGRSRRKSEMLMERIVDKKEVLERSNDTLCPGSSGKLKVRKGKSNNYIYRRDVSVIDLWLTWCQGHAIVGICN